LRIEGSLSRQVGTAGSFNAVRESPGNIAAISGSHCERLQGYFVVSELRRIEPKYFLE